MIGPEIFGGDPDKEFAVSDNRMTHRVIPQGLRQHLLSQNTVVLIIAHRDFAEDHLALHLAVRVRNQRVEDHLGQSLHRGFKALLWRIDVVDGAIKGGVGVGITARTVDGFGQFTVRKTPRAFKDHVFQVMRNAGAFPASFLCAPSPHPCLDRT